jgi:hypothetical protein
VQNFPIRDAAFVEQVARAYRFGTMPIRVLANAFGMNSSEIYALAKRLAGNPPPPRRRRSEPLR